MSFHPDAFFAAKAVSGLVLLGIVLKLGLRSEKGKRGERPSLVLARRFYLVLGALLVFSPTLFPWYLGWIVPFLCLFPNPAWICLTCTIQIYYLRFWNVPVGYLTFADLPWLSLPWEVEIGRPLEYLPFYALLLWGWWRSKSPRDPGNELED